jgi:DNA-binding response OmpR family regulator
MTTKILVVDDEQFIRNALGKFLSAKGYDVYKAQDGDEALSAYQLNRPDIVILDIRMPGKDGVETLRELKEIDPQVNVIMVSAVHEEETAKEAMDEGAFDYITKPIDPNYLELCLNTRLVMSGIPI